ncbi:WbqC family protein [Halomonas sp. DWK9]|uniref:WbqC family protein n=1 Tax=Halomonas sp. DWK9 TaxID=3060155 RepID=UPI00287F8872|nr:WbqC family protein [Halomonas sp. DWK9]
MKAAIMQPYFFPYIGYFSLIYHSDTFILFDTPQFSRHGWIERNRIIGPQGTPTYIKVPLKKFSHRTPICNIQINNIDKWKEKIIAQITHYKKKAPYYKAVEELINNSLRGEFTTITQINHSTIMSVCNYLGINTYVQIFSEMNLSIPPVKEPDEWALEICKTIGADTYLNSPGGISFFNPAKYKNAGISLKFIKTTSNPYKQLNNSFIPDLSIIDNMMFNEPQKIINEIINNTKYISHE